MEALQNRIDSFSKPKRVKPKKGKSTTTVLIKWPHPSDFTATPLSLAEAGFYYNPSYEDRDNVTCYMCGKELSDWDRDDDPFNIHWEKCKGSCAWATVRCGLREDLENDDFVFKDKTRLPTSKSMEKARLETFTAHDWWPHDGTKNHGATSKKVAQAGFVYTPQFPGDDLATCLYCNTALSGWDAEDNPLEEHRKRETKSGVPCPFFNPTEPLSNIASKPPSNSKPPPSKTRTKSRAPVDEDSEDELAIATKNNKKVKPASNVGIGTTPSSSLTKNKRSTRATSSRYGSEVEDTADSDGGAGKKKATAKTTKTRTVNGKADSEVEEDAESDAGPVGKKKRGAAKGKIKERVQAIEEEDEDEAVEVKVKQVKKAATSKTRKSTRAVSERAAYEVEDMADSDFRAGKLKSTSKARKSTRSVDSKAVEVEDDMESDVGNKRKKPKSKGKVTEAIELIDEETEAEIADVKMETVKKIITGRSTKQGRSKNITTPEEVVNTVEENIAEADGVIGEPVAAVPTRVSGKQGKRKIVVEVAVPLEVPEPKQEPPEEENPNVITEVLPNEEVGDQQLELQEFVKPAIPASSSTLPKGFDLSATIQNAQWVQENEDVKTLRSDINPSSELGVSSVPSGLTAPAYSDIPGQIVVNAEPLLQPGSSLLSSSSDNSAEPVVSREGHIPVAYDLTSKPDTFPFLPPLASIPTYKLAVLSEDELKMTVEQWIRHEMSVQYDLFKADGERKMEDFRKRAEEVRRGIEAL